MAEGGDSGAGLGSYPPDPAGTRDYRTWVRRLVRLSLKLGIYPSREALAESAGFDGATLSNAMHGRRHVSEEILRRLGAALGLDKPWVSWLVWWMTAQRAPTAALRNRALAEMRAIEPALSPLRPPSPGGDGFRGTYVTLPHPLSTWLGRVLYTMAQLPDFDPDPVRISVALDRAATPRAIADTLRTLRECGALVPGPGGRPLTQEQHLIPASPTSAQPNVEAMRRARQALLLWGEGADVCARVGFVPEDRIISWGWELVREDRQRAIAQEDRVGTVRAARPEPNADLPRANMVAQSITLALILRWPGGDPVEVPPASPAPPSLPSPVERSLGPSLFEHTHPESWLRVALRANRGTRHPHSQRALIEAGISAARMRYMMHPELGRHLPLDEADLSLLSALFRLGPPSQRLLRRLTQFHQARSAAERRVLLDELVGLVEAEHERLGTGAGRRGATRLEHLLVRGLLARGLRHAEPIAEVLGWPRERVWPILRDLRLAGLLGEERAFLAVGAPRQDFASLRLADDLLQQAAHQIEAGQDRLYHRVDQLPLRPELLCSARDAQWALVDRKAALTQGEGPWVPVVLLSAIHRVSRCLS